MATGRSAFSPRIHGILTLTASTLWAKETYAPAGHPSFRAFFPVYPYCNTVHPEGERISAPLRVHTGELDDWTPSAPYAKLVSSIRASGQDAAITLTRRAGGGAGRP